MTSPAVRVAFDSEGVRVFSWSLTPAAIGDKLAISAFSRVTVYVYDLKGSGSVAMEVSPDPAGVLWGTAHDGQGDLLIGMRSGSVESLGDQAALYLRPVVGRGIESVTVQVVLKP